MQQQNRVWPWLLTMGLAVVLSITLIQSDILSRISYAAEKGRLQADREQLIRLAGDRSHPGSGALTELSQAFRLVAKNVRPAVVNIDTTTQSASLQERIERMPEGLRREFRNQLPENHPELGGAPQIETGRGSGMIVDADDGLILTNHHVIEGADTISVTLGDGRRFPATRVSVDTMTDMAVIQIDASHLHEVVFGDSGELEVGDFVLAIGSPFGYSQSVSHGIVSAKGRTQFGMLDYTNFIQTDASINPGNSGGPLVNLFGEVVGMNTAIATRTGADSGIGFAIPSNRIRAWLPDLLSGRPVVRGYLGSVIQSVREQREQAIGLGWEDEYGVLIPRGPIKGGPADRAGIQANDIIVAIDGERTETAADLQEMIARTRPGTQISMDVWRKKRLRSVRVEIEAQPEHFSTRETPSRLRLPEESRDAEPETAYANGLGLEVETLDSELAERFGWESESGGVVVTEVESAGAANRVLRPGDLILEVQGDDVQSAPEFWRRVVPQLVDGESIRLSIKRPQRGRRNVILRPR